MNKILFWNVDTQYDFMRKNGKLYVQDAELIEPNLQLLTNAAKEKNIQVVNSADAHTIHSKEISNSPDFQNTFPEHCIIGTSGFEYIEATKPEKPFIVKYTDVILNSKKIINTRNIVIYKDVFDVFEGNKHTKEIVKLINPEIVIIFGVTTNVCVDQAVMGLTKMGKTIIVVKDAIKELPNLQSPEEKWIKNSVIFMNTREIFEWI